ncbi:MAG: hypothetical protein XU08_C0002G0015 [candidate division WWE3 bacterium CSP1-7]|uniref:Uncharacterized protein n=1 Tax=candidate division WWE3 bacterium CSP1-7 TaxID=1576480 RepID=A0A0T5ZXV1_UNCKA|nr:MAG: hypothetical protein XU08_C0002G0015 [candidate division WWE3 bacterium CSP1-7]
MNRKLIFALVLVFAVGLVGCTGNVPASATIAPTQEPTATLPPTAVPTEVPEPVTMEVAMHVDLPADQDGACPEWLLDDPSLAPLVDLGRYEIGQVYSWEVFEAPTVESPVLEVLPAGASYRLTAGPICADQLVWFQIDSPSGWMTFAILIGDDLFLVPR